MCSAEPDVSGTWTFRFEPPSSGGGITREDVVTAQLQQVEPGAFSLGRLVWGSFTSTDKGFFDMLPIPRLTMNDGSKTGSILGCNLTINIPTGIVTDDTTPPAQLALSLAGSVVQTGLMANRQDQPSTVIMAEDLTMTPKAFAWSASR